MTTPTTVKKRYSREDLYSWAMVGELKLLERVRGPKKGSANLRKRWRCQCSCGTTLVVPEFYLLREVPKTHCGCKTATIKTKNKSLYTIWLMMHQRCHFPHHHAYANYGGRGITICDRWNRLVTPPDEAFANFMADVGKRPSMQHTIDRYPDNDGPYAPHNVRWATAVEQASNRRPQKTWTK